MRGLTVAALVAAALLYWFRTPDDRWEGYVYPNRTNLFSHEFAGTFGSLEECRGAAIRALAFVGSNTFRGDYECGLNCDNDGGFRVCERTER